MILILFSLYFLLIISFFSEDLLARHLENDVLCLLCECCYGEVFNVFSCKVIYLSGLD